MFEWKFQFCSLSLFGQYKISLLVAKQERVVEGIFVNPRGQDIICRKAGNKQDQRILLLEFNRLCIWASLVAFMKIFAFCSKGIV